jgi:hypothetical protein
MALARSGAMPWHSCNTCRGTGTSAMATIVRAQMRRWGTVLLPSGLLRGILGVAQLCKDAQSKLRICFVLAVHAARRGPSGLSLPSGKAEPTRLSPARPRSMRALLCHPLTLP